MGLINECEHIKTCKYYKVDSIICVSKLKFACSYYHYKIYEKKEDEEKEST